MFAYGSIRQILNYRKRNKQKLGKYADIPNCIEISPSDALVGVIQKCFFVSEQIYLRKLSFLVLTHSITSSIFTYACESEYHPVKYVFENLKIGRYIL